MNSYMHQTVDINLKDLIFVIIKKLWLVLLVGIVFAGGVFAYKFRQKTTRVNALDTSVKLAGESDVDYAARVLKVNRAKDIMSSIDVYKNQIEYQRAYMTDSILMHIDSTNEAVTTAQLYISIDDNKSSGIDSALVSAYTQDLLSADYLSGLADELGIEQGYLKELISVEYLESSSVVVSSDDKYGFAGTIVITIIGSNTDFTDELMNLVIEEVNSEYKVINASMVPHKITVADRQNYYMLDVNTREQQYNATNRIEIIQKQIVTYEASLDDVASKLGVGSKENIYAYFLYDDVNWLTSYTSVKKTILYSFVGFVFGALLVSFVIFINYLFGKRFATQGNFFGRYPLVTKIGVVKPSKKRNRIIEFLDKKMGDDSVLSDEINNKIIAANIKNLTSGMDKVLITGTAESSKIKALVAKLGVKADFKESFFIDPETLASLSGYDGVVIVEQRKHSNCRMITEELLLIANSNAKLVGAIII